VNLAVLGAAILGAGYYLIRHECHVNRLALAKEVDDLKREVRQVKKEVDCLKPDLGELLMNTRHTDAVAGRTVLLVKDLAPPTVEPPPVPVADNLPPSSTPRPISPQRTQKKDPS
jgi:hypothetical protein